VQEKGEGVRILFLKSKDKYNELKAVGTFPDVEAGEKLWVELSHDKIGIYDKETGKIIV
jgi:hypothetical protein